MTSIWRIGGGRGVEIGGSRVVHGVAAVAEQVSPRGSSVMQGSCSKVPVSSIDKFWLEFRLEKPREFWLEIP